MINANEARQKMNKDVALNWCKEQVEKSILRAIENGRNKTCLCDTTCYMNEDGTVGSYSTSNRRIDCEYEIKNWLRDLGYRIEPTGYIGGVWQRTEDICW